MEKISRYIIRTAETSDFNSVIELLQSENLPVLDLYPDLPNFFILEEEGKIVGSIGLELHYPEALLRSLVVHQDFRNKMFASELINKLLSYAAGAGIENLFLITTTAENYFSRKGFNKIDRDKVPLAIRETTEFSTICPSSATVMVKKLQ